MQSDITQATTSQLLNGVPNYSVNPARIDEAGQNDETYWDNKDWSKWLGYYKKIPEFKEAIRALARWTVGKGFTTDSVTKIILDDIKGWGEDSFQQILTNMIIVKKVNGDAFAEIIRDDDGEILNLKPINPSNIRTIVNKKGIIIRYEEFESSSKQTKRKFLPREIFHLCNDRITNEIHGTSVLEACQWVIDARNEAMSDWRRISHRSTIRVLYIDEEDTARLNTVKEQYKEGIKNGEILLLPAKKGDAEFDDLQLPPVTNYLEWIRYLEGFFYQALGVPKAIANTADFTEAASKVGYLTFEPVYTEEQTLLEQDLWNQLGIKIKFNRPPSLHGVLAEDEEKNTGQTGFQPNEMMASAGRVE